MILEPGSKVLVVHRRLFENDRARYFVGAVDKCEGVLARITGKTWVQDPFNSAFLRKEDPRTKIVSLESGSMIVYVLPGYIELSALTFDYSNKGQVFLHSPDNSFRMDLSEGVRGLRQGE